jgi:ABC-type phosphate transport system permease subunit
VASPRPAPEEEMDKLLIIFLIRFVIPAFIILLLFHFLFFKGVGHIKKRINRFLEKKSWSKTKKDLVGLAFIIVIGLILIAYEWVFHK